MIIAGGVYREECIRPRWSRIFGSGGRAAAAVSVLSPGSTLISYACSQWAEDVRHSMAAFGTTTALREIDEDISFHYLHPLSKTELIGAPPSRLASLRAEGAAVLRFGFVEGDAVVHGDRVVYDPQSSSDALRFRENGSTAVDLAVVLNATELELSTGLSAERGARELMLRCGASVVVVKMGPFGAIVVDQTAVYAIPAYPSEAVFKIGSGDVFSAVFAHLWGEKRAGPSEAAEFASRAVARYVETKNVQVVPKLFDAAGPLKSPSAVGIIYLAGPFFTLSQRWLIEEARRCLQILGAQTFSPIHDVGAHGGPSMIAKQDLEGLEGCSSVLALVDGEDAGTLFEVGYARKLGIPVVALAESPRPESLTMLEGTGCQIADDFSTAIYKAIWASAR